MTLNEWWLPDLPLTRHRFALAVLAVAAGRRCGDGVGAGGRASIPFLKAMGAVSVAEAQRRCPGLVVSDATDNWVAARRVEWELCGGRGGM